MYRNIIANLLAQAFIAIAGLLSIPLLLNKLGAEVMGIVYFYTITQSIFLLFDAGLSGALTRESALVRSSRLNGGSFIKLFKAAEMLMVSVGIIVGVAFFTFAEEIANGWLNVGHLSVVSVIYDLRIIAVISSVRFVSCVYRSVLIGFEAQVWLSGFNIAISFLRYFGVLPVLLLCGENDFVYFNFQLAIAFAELFIILFYCNRIVAGYVCKVTFWDRIDAIRCSWRFSLQLFLISSIWVVYTQFDKLLLSKFLELHEFGYFSLGISLSGALLLVGGPLSNAMMPKIAQAYEDGRMIFASKLYRNATRLLCCIISPVLVVYCIFPELVIFAWTGNVDVAIRSKDTLVYYSIGNAFLALSGMPFLLQYAVGRLKINIAAGVLLLFISIPLMTFSIYSYGTLGAGICWLSVNFVYFLIFVTVAHVRFLSGLHSLWILRDVVFPSLLAFIMAVVCLYIFEYNRHERSEAIFSVGALFILSFLSSLLSFPVVRGNVLYLIKRLIGMRNAVRPAFKIE